MMLHQTADYTKDLRFTEISRPFTPPFTAYSLTIKVFMEKETELSLSPNTAGLPFLIFRAVSSFLAEIGVRIAGF